MKESMKILKWQDFENLGTGGMEGNATLRRGAGARVYGIRNLPYSHIALGALL